MNAWLFWLTLASDANAPETVAQRVAHLEADAGALEPKLVFLTSQYVKPELYETHEPIDARVSDGEILSLLGDWVRASIVLYDVVSRPENKNHPLYDRALFYLGESEYQTRNYYEARSDFQQLIERGSKEFLFEAFGRLVEIADVIHDYSGVEKEVAAMKSVGAGELRPDVAYHYGKSLERRGESALAEAQLKTVPFGHKFYARARYIIGVGETRQGHMQEAVPYFLESAHAKNPLGPAAKPEEDTHFSELAWLAVARVYNELGKNAEALDAYQNIAQKSPYFDDMLYEVAWSFVRQAASADKPSDKKLDYQKALDALELLLLSESERALMPKARLLRGNVLLKLDRADEAGTAFNGIINRYGSTKIELDKIDREQKDPVVYFNRVIAKNQGVFNAAAFLPPLAVPFVSGELEVTQALGIANDLGSGKSSIAEGRLIAEKLKEALKTRRAVEFYPRLQEGESRSIELEANTMVLLERTVAIERELGDHLIARNAWPALDVLARDKDQAARAYRALPATRDQIQKRREAREHDFAALSERAFHLRYDVQAQRAQLVAAKKYLDDAEVAHGIDQATAEGTRRQVAEALAQVGELERSEKQLETQIEEARTSYALSNDPHGNEEIARQKYVASLGQELTALDEAFFRTADKEAQRLHAVRERLLGYTHRLGEFRATLDEIVSRKSAEMLQLVAAEENNLGDSERDLEVCQKDASELVGAVAYRAFQTVRGKFFQLLLEADVGGIDVAWAEKEEQTQAINKLVSDQKDALKALDKAFEDVLRGDDAGWLVIFFVAALAFSAADDPLKALEDTVRAYEAAVRAMQEEVKAQIERTYAQRKEDIGKAFEAHIRELEVVERERRLEAIARFETFLKRYPSEPRYSPDAMFRLAELYFERSSDEFFLAMLDWQAALKNAKNGEEPPQPKHEYKDAVALYEKLIAQFPNYRLIDGAYYLLGYCQGEEGDEELATRSFETLVAKFPDSRFVPEAYTRIGEYYFDANDLPKAAAAYEQVLRYKDSPFYDKALYKLAWTYYRQDRFDDAVKHFTELVDYAEASQGKGSDLRQEAIQYMGISFAEETWGGVDKAKSFFAGTSARPWAFEVYTMLGDVYFDQTKYPEAVRAYELALLGNPNNPDAPKLQDKIVQAYERSRDFDNAAKARERLAAAYVEGNAWARANQDNTDALAAARDISEKSLLAAAVFHHRQAQTYREAKKNDAAREEYALAAQGYAAYLKRFPAAKNRYDLSYYLADCQYYSLQFALAADSYGKVRDDDSSDTHREPAAFSAVLACEREIQLEEQHRTLAPRPIVKSADRPASLPVKAETLPEPKQDLVDACDAYQTRATDETAKSPAGDKRAAVAYKAAEVFYAYDNFDEARRRFADIIARFPSSDVARYAANLTIESYLAEKRFSDVEQFSRDALANAALGHGSGGFAGDLQKFKLGAMFKQAEMLDEQKQYDAAAAAYIRLIDDNPKSSFADKALNNAAVDFEKAHRYESAMKLYERVYRDFPNSPLADYALFRVGVNAERFYEFGRAIDSYLQLVDKYAKSEHAADALYNAALALENTQQYKRAEEEYQRYAKLFPQREDAPEVFFRSARAAQNASERERAIQIYGEFVKKYAHAKGQDERVVEAWFESGQLLEAAHDDKAARRAYATAVSEANHRSKGQAFAAHAQFAVAEMEFRDYDAVKVEGTSKAQKDAIVKRSKLLTSVRDEFQKVFAFKQVEWTLASLYRIGSLYETFADTLFSAPAPPEIKKLGPDYVEEYRVLLEEKAEPLEDKAVEAYKRTIEEAKKASVGNAWTKQTLVSLNKLRKKEFPLQKDAKFSVELVPVEIPEMPSSLPVEAAK